MWWGLKYIYQLQAVSGVQTYISVAGNRNRWFDQCWNDTLYTSKSDMQQIWN